MEARSSSLRTDADVIVGNAGLLELLSRNAASEIYAIRFLVGHLSRRYGNVPPIEQHCVGTLNFLKNFL